MGLITNNYQSRNHFLAKYGFKYDVRSGPQGETGFTRSYIHANNTECLWITVNFDQNMVYFYNEFECGGGLSNYKCIIPPCIENDEDKFIKWLEEQIPTDTD